MTRTAIALLAILLATPTLRADPERLKEADVVVSAIGKPVWIKADMVRDDVVLIDVGTTKSTDGKTRGDVDANSFEKTDAWLTPVPGGVGPMTIALLLANVVKLSQNL